MTSIRGITAALNGTGAYKYRAPEFIGDFVIVGGGVVGLAIAARLSQKFPDRTTFLLERHAQAGQETSSRNSEVVHAGLYYPPESLKTRFCLRGRRLLYEHCQEHGVPYRKTGKLVVAREHQCAYIENLHSKAEKLKWPKHSSPTLSSDPVLPTKLISGEQARSMEPELSESIKAALWSPETGIVDAHSLMESLEKEASESGSADLLYSTRVVRVDPHNPSTQAMGAPDIDSAEEGWVVQMVTKTAGEDAEPATILARTLINASGLSGNLILNSLLPKEARIPMYFPRGSYASYKGPGISGISHLIYPCPDTGPTAHAFQSLGTHLTLDLQGNVRFGPDIEWVAPPYGHGGSEEDNIDFWKNHLVADESRLGVMHEAITQYLPNISLGGLRPDYVGIRPKLVGPGGGFQDFILRRDRSSDFTNSGKQKGTMISLLGIESPGLTASLALAETVVEDMLAEQGK